MKNPIIILIALLLAASAWAATVNDTYFNLTAANSSINITYPWYVDSLTWNTTYLKAYNLAGNNPNATNPYELTFNFTDDDRRYRGTQFPYVDTISNSQIVIVSNLQERINISLWAVILAAPASVTYHSALGNYTTITGLSINPTLLMMNLSVITLEYGRNELNFTYASSGHGSHVEGICNRMYIVYGFVGVLTIVFVGAGILMMMGGGIAMPIILAAISGLIVAVLGIIILAEVCV